jgi:hypothetical protein
MISDKILESGQNLATQKVIGYSYHTRKVKGGKRHPEEIQESLSIGIQAWEAAALLAGVALFDYVEGAGSFIGLAEMFVSGMQGKPPGQPSVPGSGLPSFPLTIGLTTLP